MEHAYKFLCDSAEKDKEDLRRNPVNKLFFSSLKY